MYDVDDEFNVVIQPPTVNEVVQPVVAVVQPIIMPPVTQPPIRSNCVLPNNMNFTPSINGRNGWNFENFYDISAEVSLNVSYTCSSSNHATEC